VTGVRLELSIPGLVVLVGAAGAGKSTLAARLFRPDDIVSSDSFREMVSGDAGDQRATRNAFGILHREVRRRLADRRLVVVDATNVERAARLQLLRIAAIVGAPTTAIVILGAGNDIHARNAARFGRVVPADIVDRHLGRLALLGEHPAAVGATLRLEGFGAVHVVRSGDEIHGVNVIALAAAPAVADSPA
jgi:protein phosphatase